MSSPISKRIHTTNSFSEFCPATIDLCQLLFSYGALPRCWKWIIPFSILSNQKLQYFSLHYFLHENGISIITFYSQKLNSWTFLSYHCRTQSYYFLSRKKQNFNTHFSLSYLKFSVLSMTFGIPSATSRLLDTALKNCQTMLRLQIFKH